MHNGQRCTSKHFAGQYADYVQVPVCDALHTLGSLTPSMTTVLLCPDDD